jgi:hypothetical protein
MDCPAPEDLSRWIDGAAEPAAAAATERHAEACAACRARVETLRAAARWIETLAEPGPDCLSADEMAAALEGKGTPPHLRVCPRCAAEFRALRPSRKGTQRTYRVRSGAMPWVAAAAAVAIAAAGLWIAQRPATPSPDVATKRPPPPPPPVPALPEREPIKLPENVVTPPAPQTPKAPPVPPETPKAPPSPEPRTNEPDSIVRPPVPPAEPPKPPPAPAPGPTIVEPERKAVAIAVKSGALAVQQGAKWVKAPRIEEGRPFRAEGRTVCEFAGANLTLEASSRVEFQGADLALHDGGLSVEVPPGAPFALAVAGQRLEPLHSSRVMMVARADRVVVEEGAARAGAALLHEGVEYAVRRDKIEAQRRRSLPAAARPREILTWRLDLSQPALVRPRLVAGRLSAEGDQRFLVSAPVENGVWQSQLGYHTGDPERPVLVVRAGTTVRFRYFLTQPADLELVMWNATKAENFNKPLASVPGRWTTVTLAMREIPANRGGKPVVCETGDRYVSFGVFVGKPGSTAELFVDHLEVLEIDR